MNSKATDRHRDITNFRQRIVDIFCRRFRSSSAHGAAIYNLASFILLAFLSYFMLRNLRIHDNLMFRSGVLATIAALLIGTLTDGSTKRLLHTMKEAGLVRAAAYSLSDVDQAQRHANVVCHVGFFVVLSVGGLAYVLVEGDGTATVPYFLGYLLTGLRFGRVAANGALGANLNKKGTRLNLRLGHRDGASGLAFVGDFFLRQLSGLVIPMSWLTFWLISIVVNEEDYTRYAQWWWLYLLLFATVVAIACFALLRPMVDFGKMMRRWMADSETQKREKHRLGKQEYDYEIALMPKVPISPNAVLTALFGVVFPMALAAAYAIITRGAT